MHAVCVFLFSYPGNLHSVLNHLTKTPTLRPGRPSLSLKTSWIWVSNFEYPFFLLLLLPYLMYFSHVFCHRLHNVVKIQGFWLWSIRTASGPIALILVPNVDLARQIKATFDKFRTFFLDIDGKLVRVFVIFDSWELRPRVTRASRLVRFACSRAVRP